MPSGEPSWWKQTLAVVATGGLIVAAVVAYRFMHAATSDKAEGGGMAGMEMGSGTRGEGGSSKRQGTPSAKKKQNQPAEKPNERDEADVPQHATVVISNKLRQQLGVTIGRVERKRMKMSVRAVGIVQPDETRVAKVHLKTEGWVDKLFVNYTGQKVKAGDPLLAIYSPQFLTAQSEYLTSRRGRDTPLADVALRKLELLDVPPNEIEELERSGKPQKDITLRSPIGGTVLKKDAFEDQYVTAQKELYEIADLSTVWVQAKIYEYELPHVHLDQPATVTVEALPDEELKGKVVFIQATVEQPTRTVEVRVELPNEEGVLRPGMFAEIRIDHDMGEGLLVSEEAVIRTGEHTYAFRADDNDRFVPVEVSISPLRFEEQYQVLAGLEEGDRVVTSANFLIDSESRLRFGGGMSGMAGMSGMEMGGMKMEGKEQEGDKGGMDMPGMDMGRK